MPNAETSEAPLTIALQKLLDKTQRIQSKVKDLSSQLDSVLSPGVPAPIMEVPPEPVAPRSATVNMILEAICHLDNGIGHLEELSSRLDVF